MWISRTLKEVKDALWFFVADFIDDRFGSSQNITARAVEDLLGGSNFNPCQKRSQFARKTCKESIN